MGLLITLQIMEHSDLTCSPPQNSSEVPAARGQEKGLTPWVKKIQSLGPLGTAGAFFTHSFSRAQSTRQNWAMLLDTEKQFLKSQEL